MKKLIVILFAPILLFTSCSEDEATANQQGQKPVTPPASSMAPDFDAFSENSNSGKREATIENWGYAAINVGVYSAILYNHLIIPVKGFQATIDTEATFDTETNLWVWDKTLDVPTKGSYKVKLTAAVDGQDVDWKGYISKGTALANFVWFEGESKLNGESGSWMLYESPETPVVWLSSAWERNEANATTSTTFTVEKEGSNKGSYITYKTDNNADLSRMVIISDINSDTKIYTDWNHTNNKGRVKSESHFKDSLFHCWDSNYQNSQCD